MISNLFSLASKVGVSYIFSIVLPGLILTLLLLPIINPLVPSIVRIDKLADLATILLPEILVIGLLISLLRNIVYRIYEGRLLWPQRLHRSFTKHIDQRVKKRLKQAGNLDKSSTRYKELWYWLRIFPLDNNGDPTAKHPTILGNILEGYEEYPFRRYGMDSIFYWYRLWPTLPENFIKSMNQLWAEADCLMYISFSGLAMFLVYTILAIAKWIFHWMAFLPTQTHFDAIPAVGEPMVWAICCLISGYAVYRISFSLHRRNGEYFKAAFDLYRDNIFKVTAFSSDEKAKWREIFNYLQYMGVQCPDCGKYYFAEAEKCPHCAETRLSI
jgi:hypothetical protein